MTKKGYKQTSEHVTKRIDARLETLSAKPKPVTKEWLEEHYLAQHLDCVQIGALLGYDPKTIWSWLRYYGIPSRPRGGKTSPGSFQKGQPNAFAGRHHSESAKERIREARLSDGHVPYLKNGEHWLKEDSAIHPNWKGGITPERQVVYASEEWRESCKVVWARADARCECCGKHHNTRTARGTFHIHHIVGFENVELRTSPDNLMLVCRKCHLWIHSRRNEQGQFIGEEERCRIKSK